MSLESYLVRQIDRRIERSKMPRVKHEPVEQVRVWRSVDDVSTFDFGAAVRRAERAAEREVVTKVSYC